MEVINAVARTLTLLFYVQAPQEGNGESHACRSRVSDAERNAHMCHHFLSSCAIGELAPADRWIVGGWMDEWQMVV